MLTELPFSFLAKQHPNSFQCFALIPAHNHCKDSDSHPPQPLLRFSSDHVKILPVRGDSRSSCWPGTGSLGPGMLGMNKKIGIDLERRRCCTSQSGDCHQRAVCGCDFQNRQTVLAVGKKAKDMFTYAGHDCCASSLRFAIADYKTTEAMLRYFANKRSAVSGCFVRR